MLRRSQFVPRTLLFLMALTVGCESTPAQPTRDAVVATDLIDDLASRDDVRDDVREDARDASSGEPLPSSTNACEHATPLLFNEDIDFTVPESGEETLHCDYFDGGPPPPPDASAGTARHFSLRVPARTTAEVIAYPTAFTPARLRVYRECRSEACLAETNSMGSLYLVARALAHNTTDEAHDFFLTVQPEYSGSGRAYTLGARSTDAGRNTTCADAIRLLPGVERAHELLPAAPGAALPCAMIAFATFTPLWYVVSVAPGQTVEVTVRGDLTRSLPVLRLYDGCVATDCLAVAAESSGPSQSVRWTNDGTIARELFVAAARRADTSAGRFNLRASIVRGP